MADLNEAIDRFYLEFQDIPAPTIIDACPCCVPTAEIEILLSVPKRELTADQLQSYSSSAFLTAGDVTDYLYFLPRILELSIRDELWWPSPKVIGRATKSADLHNWPETKQQAMTDLLLSVVQYFVDTGKPRASTNGCVRSVEWV